MSGVSPQTGSGGRRGARRRPRIAVAGFQHETNTFTPLYASLRDFEREDGWPGLTEAADVVDTFSGTNIPIGGFVDAMRNRAELLPVLWASAEPSNRVSDAAFESISGRIVQGFTDRMPLDGIYLDLHGAMVTESHEDGEGELLRRIRARLGPEIPLAASLDLHANVTPETVELADVLTVFRTYPHLDMAAAGERAGALLLETIERRKRPHRAFRKLPFLVPLHAQCTDCEPSRSLYANLPADGTLASGTADVAFGFPAADVRMCGPSILAASFAADDAESMADALQRQFLDARNRFPVRLESPERAVRVAMDRGRPGRPVVLADVQDNSGAGGTSDSTGLLAELVKAGAKDAALAALCDPEAARAAHQAGVGGRIRLQLGGKHGGPENPGLSGEFRVAALSDGAFDFRGEMMRGIRAKLGPTAALTCGDADVRVVVTGERIQCLDRAVFSHVGIRPEAMAVVAVKSTVHFRADFAPFAEAIVPVEAPGYNPCRLQNVPYRRLRSGVELL